MYPLILNVNPMPFECSSLNLKHQTLIAFPFMYALVQFKLSFIAIIYNLCILDSFYFFPLSLGLCKFVSYLLLSCLSILLFNAFSAFFTFVRIVASFIAYLVSKNACDHLLLSPLFLVGLFLLLYAFNHAFNHAPIYLLYLSYF